MFDSGSFRRKIEQVLNSKEFKSEKEVNLFMEEFMEQHNQKMEDINKKLGGGLGVFLAKADRFIEQEKYEKAIKVCNQILVVYPECDEAWLIRLEADLATDNYDDANICFEMCKKIDPDNPYLYYLKWQLELEKILQSSKSGAEDYRKTLNYLDAALKVSPKYFDALMSKAQVLFWLGDEKYKKLISKCSKIDPVRSKNFMKNHWIEEIPGCHPLAVLDDSISKIENFMSKAEYESALKEIDSIINLPVKPQFKEVIYSMKAETLIGLKDYAQASKVIAALIKLNKNYPKPYFHQAVIHYNCSKLNEALEAIDKCIEVAESVSMKHPQYYDLKADILKKLGQDNWPYFEKKANEIQAENMKMFKKLCKQKGLNPKDFNC